MGRRAENFMRANKESKVVYGSVFEGGVVYRLANGQTFRLTSAESRTIGVPMWQLC